MVGIQENFLDRIGKNDFSAVGIRVGHNVHVEANTLLCLTSQEDMEIAWAEFAHGNFLLQYNVLRQMYRRWQERYCLGQRKCV